MSLKQLTSSREFDQLLGEPLAIVLKHSTMCPVSSRAHQEIQKFLETHRTIDVFKVHVIEDRAVSDHIESATGVRHESPQLLIFRNGELVWHDSHFAVTAAAVAVRLEQTQEAEI